MGIVKALVSISVIFLILFALAIWLLPGWVWIVMLVLFIIFILVCIFVPPVGAAVVGAFGMAAEAAGAAAESGLLSRLFGAGASPGSSGAPSGTSGHLILPLILITALGAAIYFVLNKLGLNTMTSGLVILLVILLGVWHKLNPTGSAHALKAAAISAFGIMAMFLLSTLPGKSHIFVSIFIVFFLIGTLAIAGAGTFLIVLIIFAVTGTAVFEFAPSLLTSGTPLDLAIKGQQKAWSDITSTASSFITGAQKGVERQILVAPTNH